MKNVLELAEKHGVEWHVDEDMTNGELEKLFYTERRTADKHYAEPGYTYIYKELSKKGVTVTVTVTLTLLWQEYFYVTIIVAR